jgi:hypothetical protein
VEEVYLPRECCEVIRPRNLKPPAGSVGAGGGLKETVNETEWEINNV